MVLLFEKDISDSTFSHIGVYTMDISDELRLSNLVTVVESDTEDKTGLGFELLISDLDNPQISFENVTCSIADAETCAVLTETYFSQLVRTF